MIDGFALLLHLAVPTLIIRRERSPCLGERETADALASLRSGRVATIAGAGHFVPMERPEKVAAAIAAFLA
jgi:pimeloyl-ACP methyl ester carboxylesterase